MWGEYGGFLPPLGVYVARKMPFFIISPLEQEGGISGFYALLKAMDLNPRTLGTTDYPVSAPLNEVLRMLDECSAMIVLGVSQISAKTGTLKGEKLRNL